MSREYSDSDTIEEKREKTEESEAGLLDITRLIDDAFKGLRLYWMAFLVVLSVCSSLFYFQAKRSYVPEYRAATTFIVNTNMTLNYSDDYYNKATASQMAKTFPYIILNNALQHIIAEDLGVTEIPGEIKAEAMEGTNMITISVTSTSPEDAYNVLQSVIRNYPRVARSVIGETELNVIDETGMPTYPINDMEAKTAAKKGFLAGVILCCLWLALYAMTKRTVRREDDFKNMLNVKCLGSMPRMKFKKRSNKEKNQILIDNPRISYGFVESSRTIRTRIERDAQEEGAKVFMVSSAIAGEGKSTVAANLALSLADKEQKVLLVDLDLRNPSVEKTLGIKTSGKGFGDVLTGKAELSQCMIRYRRSSLQILPGGTPIHMTTKLLSSARLGEIFEELRGMADYIIVDTPPSSLLTDAAQIVKHMDAGIFVVRQDYASTDRILDGIEMLTDTGLRLTGCVLNYAEVGITGYGYGLGYGYGGYGRYGKYGKYGKYGSKYTRKSRGEGNEDAV